MIIYIYGDDDFRSLKHLRETIDNFKQKRDPQGLNTVVVDCMVKSDKVIDQILALPFLSEKRMVVIKNLLSCKDEDLKKNVFEVIKSNRVPEVNVIVVWEHANDFKKKMLKEFAELLKKQQYSQRFDILKGVELASWINNELKERGCNFEADVVNFLVNHAGHNMWQLNSIIEQVASYCDGKKVEVADVELFLNEKIDDNIFNLVDAIISQQSKLVYKMIQEQYRIGEDVQFIFAMLLRQFRILLEMRDLYERQDNIRSDEIASKLKLHPFLVKKSLAMVRHYNKEKLKKIYTDLLDLDIQLKSSQSSPETLLDIFVAKVCI